MIDILRSSSWMHIQTIMTTLDNVLLEGTGGTYLIAGPDWNGQVPEGMTKIWTPTNLAWLINRILVKGPSDCA